ncbi:DUF1735 domain-containing protein [Mucilaginibacter limnophilus]|uniref:DUF1735 domain-containing protein n=1 Tax=Mucilaginibacter limnophilus TaxID=1932778 RepID=A0A437MUR0_9SPHI|nr:DUF1735 domain-containing protein [Mucilaginibacter limnophilus]RVU01381.1 DUF1735 domain-containing protein [Mucilaginibacter limnophilus]
MKSKYIFRGILPALAVVLSLSSCLKDDNVQQDFSKLQPIIEFPDETPNLNAAANSRSAAVVGAEGTVEYLVPIKYSFGENSPGVEVTVALDQSVLTKYNEVNEDDLQMLPAKYFNIPNLKVTIPAGEKVGYLKINFLNTLDEKLLSSHYALPLRITDASGKIISSNYGTTVALFAIKNIYDGVYDFRGNIQRNSATGPDPALSGQISFEEASLFTRDQYSVWFDSQLWAGGSGVAGIGTPGVDGVIFTFNPTTNKITVTCPANATLRNIEGYDSHYDPATKTVYAGFQWGGAPNTRVAIDTLKYIGPTE